MKAPARLVRLAAIELDGDALPTEFRIFAAGVNETSKGPSLFDAEAAKAVMAAYEKHGVDLMIDLNHDSLGDARMTRADAEDARGWFKLELRNGELWAVDVKWTDDGAERLRSKKQRYISPAFFQDEKSGRVEEIVNVAICAMPATHGAAPLVAASAGAPSQHDVANALNVAICAAYPTPPGTCSPAYVVDVFPDRVIYDLGGKLYAVGYAYANGAAALQGSPVHVVREYVPAGPAALRALRASLARRRAGATAQVAKPAALSAQPIKGTKKT